MAQIRFLIIQCDRGYFFHLPEIDPYTVALWVQDTPIHESSAFQMFIFDVYMLLFILWNANSHTEYAIFPFARTAKICCSALSGWINSI